MLHLTNDIFKIEFGVVAVHVGQTLALLFVEKLKLISRHHSITVQIQYIEPILDAVLCTFILDTINEPRKIAECHFFGVLEFASYLGKYPLNSFSR